MPALGRSFTTTPPCTPTRYRQGSFAQPSFRSHQSMSFTNATSDSGRRCLAAVHSLFAELQRTCTQLERVANATHQLVATREMMAANDSGCMGHTPTRNLPFGGSGIVIQAIALEARETLGHRWRRLEALAASWAASGSVDIGAPADNNGPAPVDAVTFADMSLGAMLGVLGDMAEDLKLKACGGAPIVEPPSALYAVAAQPSFAVSTPAQLPQRAANAHDERFHRETMLRHGAGDRHDDDDDGAAVAQPGRREAHGGRSGLPPPPESPLIAPRSPLFRRQHDDVSVTPITVPSAVRYPTPPPRHTDPDTVRHQAAALVSREPFVDDGDDELALARRARSERQLKKQPSAVAPPPPTTDGEMDMPSAIASRRASPDRRGSPPRGSGAVSAQHTMPPRPQSAHTQQWAPAAGLASPGSSPLTPRRQQGVLGRMFEHIRRQQAANLPTRIEDSPIHSLVTIG
jgi:hypothetical protein